MTAQETQLIGKGLYAIAEAARILRVPTPKLRHWAEGYSFRHRDRACFSPPVIHAELPVADGERVLTFLDLMELYFVAKFRGENMSMQYIRAAAAEGIKRFQTDHPFAVRRFFTDGYRIFAELDSQKTGSELPTEELTKRQLVFNRIVKRFSKKLDLRMDEVVRYWPLGRRGRVVIDPARSFGKPIDNETGIRTFTLYQASLCGDTFEAIARWYDVPKEAVQCAAKYERSLDRQPKVLFR